MTLKLTKSQTSKARHIFNLMRNAHGKLSNHYELRKVEVKYLNEDCDEISLYGIITYKQHQTTAFGSVVHCFISKRGKVTYVDWQDNTKIKTFTGSNIYTLICANH